YLQNSPFGLGLRVYDRLNERPELLYAYKVTPGDSKKEGKEVSENLLTYFAVRNSGNIPLSEFNLSVYFGTEEAKVLKTSVFLGEPGEFKDGWFFITKKRLAPGESFNIIFGSNKRIDDSRIDISTMEVLGARGAFRSTETKQTHWIWSLLYYFIFGIIFWNIIFRVIESAALSAWSEMLTPGEKCSYKKERDIFLVYMSKLIEVVADEEKKNKADIKKTQGS
ncbi:unnamed protein product, partial [marine sediment metagenome]